MISLTKCSQIRNLFTIYSLFKTALANVYSIDIMYLFILLIIYQSQILIKILLVLNPSVLNQYWAGYFMAQPAVSVKEDRIDLLALPPLVAKHSVNPPFLWEN